MTTDHDQVGDCPDDLESVEYEEDITEEGSKIANSLPNNVIDALKSHQDAEPKAPLPPAVKRRVNALKKLQLETTNIEALFFKEVHDLECKYHRLYVPLYEKRNTIVNGEYEPADNECEWHSDDEDEGLSTSLKEKAKLEESFKLEFYFTPNEFFTDTVLTKEYFMKCVPEEDDPFSFEGPEIFKCIGCTINWNKGKNPTIKTIKKKQKHKSRGVLRVVTKTVQNDSFFNFFSPPTIPEGTKDEDVDEDLRNLLTSDFEIGHYIRERVIPRAVLYFTGEAIEDEDYEEEEEDEEDEEEDDSDTNADGKPHECKQQ
ncbi:hypothetical protein D910_11745 [Dendroctonus ponderosae]|uniref:Nucleosome assembly protein 1-like 1 n=1 Tax=Dendroctonus ponderosae TaxID=77166 RepID=U4UPQ2_DENPD|nr:hypothetical protein D910_11745 [Dendroctonus ponderosae]